MKIKKDSKDLVKGTISGGWDLLKHGSKYDMLVTLNQIVDFSDTEKFENGQFHFADDIAKNIANGDANHLALLDEADAYVARHGLDLPEDLEERKRWPDPECLSTPTRNLNLQEEGVTTILWATGYTVDYGWLDVNTFDERGKPLHQCGVSHESGIYFLGLPWQSRRGSSFIWGVWHDAKFVCDQIAIQHTYQSYKPASEAASMNTSSKLASA